MAWFPFFMKLDGEKVLIAGGGRTGTRKALQMLEFGAHVTLISPSFLPGLEEREERAAGLCLVRRKYRPGDCRGFFAVIAATDDSRVNREIARECRAQGILVNVVDDPGECSFYFPAIVKRGDLVCGITSGGKAPFVSHRVRQDLEGFLPEDLGAITDKMGSARPLIRSLVSDQKTRALVCQELFKMLSGTGGQAPDTEIEKMIRGMVRDSKEKNHA